MSKPIIERFVVDVNDNYKCHVSSCRKNVFSSHGKTRRKCVPRCILYFTNCYILEIVLSFQSNICFAIDFSLIISSVPG